MTDPSIEPNDRKEGVTDERPVAGAGRSAAPFPRRGPRTGRADIHFHLLPGVDDGPATLDDSLELAQLASAEGTATIVATPHVRGDFVTNVSDLPDRAFEVRAVLEAEGVELDVLVGGELGHDMVGWLSQAELDSIAQGPEHGRWLLAEAPFTGLDAGFRAATRELRARGFACVLAHPERAPGVLDDGCAAIATEVRAGSVLQLNATSLTGRNGEPARSAAFELARRFPCVLGSDAHGPLRPPALCTGLRAAIAEAVPPPSAHAMIDSGPRGLLWGEMPSFGPIPAGISRP
ncbi:MAG TPA: CpsB/CapC family capsule biosynthesis tyrosine phosphatase [Thermoleophilaceae bacterium]|jgi:protein-tyrosine phosphatase